MIVSENQLPGSLQLDGGEILLDGAEHWGVIRAATDLAKDFERITDVPLKVEVANPTERTGKYEYNLPKAHVGTLQLEGPHQLLVPDFGTKGVSANTKIIVGTIGSSKLIDELIGEHQIDEVDQIKGKWESFIYKIVKDPLPGVPEALVIAGSDKRGTIFGIYTLSREIGVSPFYWWADVNPDKKSKIFVEAPKAEVFGTPSIKYRGFFLNDEAPCLTNWAAERFPKSKWGSPFNSDFYTLVFELVLRLKANYLWPCMWASMFHVDDPRSPPMADAYGVVMGTSHTEPLMRATHEWPKFGQGEWQWARNKEVVAPYFKFGLERAKPYETIYNLAMRGYDDFEMDATQEEAVAMLREVVDKQREIITEVFESLDKVPQMWCLYKEVMGYFEDGMSVPDDVILLWSDDNWGNIRRLPIESERERKGGAGLYYHFDYVGDPRNYKWINNVSLQRTWEQLNLAYKYGADQVWIVNVGDLKPMELPMSLYFDLAYDMNKYNHATITNWLEDWATREFGPKYAARVAGIGAVYSKYAAWRKYELVDPEVYSVLNYREADTVLEKWSQLETEAQALHHNLPQHKKAAFYEMLLHPIKAAHTVYRIHINAARNSLYAEQKRTSTNVYADKVLKDFQVDQDIADEYHSFLDGKWNHMVEQTHLGYNYWQQPMKDVLPPLTWVRSSTSGFKWAAALTVEGSLASVPGDDRYHDLSGSELELPPLETYGVKSRYIDVFSRQAANDAPLYWELVSADPFVKIVPSKGTVSPKGPDTRAEVSVDWDSVAQDEQKSTIYFFVAPSEKDLEVRKKENIADATVLVPVIKQKLPSDFRSGFVESEKCVSFEADQFTGATSTAEAKYIVVDDLSRTSAGVTLYPELLPTQSVPKSPKLEYSFITFSDSESSKVSVYCAPSLDIHGRDRPLKYAVAIDGEEPQFVSIATPAGCADWEKGVADNSWLRSTTHKISPGTHTLSLWAVEPAVVFQKIVIDNGGVKASYFGPPPSYKV